MHSNKLTRWGCYILFSLFSYTYLYNYQGGVLASLQHVLSDGVTSYDNLVGASVITIFLLLLTWLCQRGAVLKEKFVALSFLPAFIVLGLLTSTNSSLSCIYDFDFLMLLLIPLIIIWALLSYNKKSILLLLDIREYSIFSQSLWLNIMLMVMMMTVTGLTGNGNDLFHYRMKMEQEMKANNYEISNYASFIYDNKDNEDIENATSITMLHAYSLAKKQRLGDELFTKSVAGTSNDLLPLYNSRSSCVIYPADSIFKYLGAKPIVPMTTAEYLCVLSKKQKGSKAVGDYLLCGSLIDRDLNRFTSLLPSYYEVNESLPLHYKEALMLHNNIIGNVSDSLANDSMYNELNNIISLSSAKENKGASVLKARQLYNSTYWYYFLFE